MNTLANMLTKCKYLLHLESKLEPEERALHQWQLLTKRSGVQYICGKGGANTCFIIIGDGERTLYYPEDFIKQLAALAKQKYGSYGIWDKKAEKLYGPWPQLDVPKKRVPKRSTLVIVGIDDAGKQHEIFYASKGLDGISWVKSGQEKSK